MQMTDMQEPTTSPVFQDRYDAAMREIERKRQKSEKAGAVVMMSVMSYGNALRSDTPLKRISDLAKYFLILCAGVIPNLLFIHVVF